MLKSLALAALVIAPVLLPVTATAQTANDKVLIIFGKDPCPAGTICVRAPEEERFRIPRQLRNTGPIPPQNQSWAARANSTMEAGARSGTGSCSPSGPGGWTGCWQQQMRAARADAAQREAEQNPDIIP